MKSFPQRHVPRESTIQHSLAGAVRRAGSRVGISKSFGTVLVLVGWVVSQSPMLMAQDAPKRYTQPPDGAFVRHSVDFVETEAERAATLDRLETIARTSRAFRLPGHAVTALYHLATDGTDVQLRLLRIIMDESSSRGAHGTACKLLSLDANNDTRAALLERISSHPAIEDTSQERAALMDLGDEAFIEYFEQRVGALPDADVMKQFYGQKVRMVKAAREITTLLALLRSHEDGVNRGWLVLQAARRGAPKDDIRQAVLDYLRLDPELTARQDYSSMIPAGVQVGVFRPEDEQEFPAIHLLSNVSYSGDGSPIRWATRAETKRREVYRFGEDTE